MSQVLQPMDLGEQLAFRALFLYFAEEETRGPKADGNCMRVSGRQHLDGDNGPAFAQRPLWDPCCSLQTCVLTHDLLCRAKQDRSSVHVPWTASEV